MGTSDFLKTVYTTYYTYFSHSAVHNYMFFLLCHRSDHIYNAANKTSNRTRLIIRIHIAQLPANMQQSAARHAHKTHAARI